ncbi:ImmA/IrrE family metallo-endopeptidase [Arenibacter sp. S6351L]|uniref:ImmA/IrrE family metallo-endopeptidase n=1 Tax=Arenibacter sp. S6351L TaxID=2926407 RepID=UPI001FF3A8E9|nr:ImmA/IrrE family metallo-endopeptidase [Arenibacter sp. S6351L]MCK0137354.1 ImmA/IrrE family metallo-endopeptidase [Arenibacter sp. S6351L]
MGNKKSYKDDILKRLFEPKPTKIAETLEELFVNRLESLDIPKTTALNIMGMSVRTLDGILSGEQKMLDYTQLIKLSNFLGTDLEQIATLYLQKVNEVHNVGNDINRTNEMVEFINEKFNLAELKKVGLIKSLTDYNDIIKSICNYFGLKNIFEYSEPDINVAFSSGKRAKRNCSIKNWVYLAEQSCIELRNPNIYSRDKLIDYFPQIRWQSMDVENGLVNVIKQLYQLGITVVFIPSFPSLHIRGATFMVNDKPCIALTDYVGFYPTLWFALVHELYHVLFDWDEIQLSNYHISQEGQKSLDSESQNEIEADNFAREYLFSKEKTKEAGSFINNQEFIKQYALSNNVDPSFVYVFYAFDAPNTDKYAWGRAKKLNPNIEKLKSKLEHNFSDDFTFSDHIKKIRNKIYN